MKMIIAIVNDDYTGDLIKAIREKSYRVTKLSSTGGFLKKGNTTILMGVEDEEVDDVIEIIKEECKPEEREDDQEMKAVNLFVLDMDESHRF